MPAEQPEPATPSPEPLRSESSQAWGYGEHNWILQELHHVARDIGRLEEAVGTLKGSLVDQAKTLNWMKYVMFVAIGALFVIGYFIDKRFDQIIELLAAK